MFTWLLYNTICALPLVAIALVIPRLRRGTPALEHFLWLLVIVRLVMPPLPFLARGTAEAAPVFTSSEASLGDEIVAWATRTFGTNWSNEARWILLAAFVALLTFLILRELNRVRLVDRSIRSARGAPPHLVAHVREVAARLGVRAPEVRVLPASATPFIWSLRGPVLVLPEQGELPSETVLAHELAHLRRCDHWTSWLELVSGVFHFWNPVFWLARRRLHLQAELACDSWVVERFPDDRQAYAHALVDAVERASTGTLVPRAVHAVGVGQVDIEERLRHILKASAQVRAPRFAALGALVLVVLSLPGLGVPSLEAFRSALPDLPAGLDQDTWLRLRDRSQARIAADASDAEAYGGLGMAQLGLGEFEAAEAAYLRQIELGFEPAKALYNLACVHARAGHAEQAIAYLERSQAAGFPALDYVLQDPDLESVRDHPALAALRE